jgi:hypothetical protein
VTIFFSFSDVSNEQSNEEVELQRIMTNAAVVCLHFSNHLQELRTPKKEPLAGQRHPNRDASRATIQWEARDLPIYSSVSEGSMDFQNVRVTTAGASERTQSLWTRSKPISC